MHACLPRMVVYWRFLETIRCFSEIKVALVSVEKFSRNNPKCLGIQLPNVLHTSTRLDIFQEKNKKFLEKYLSISWVWRKFLEIYKSTEIDEIVCLLMCHF